MANSTTRADPRRRALIMAGGSVAVVGLAVISVVAWPTSLAGAVSLGQLVSVVSAIAPAAVGVVVWWRRLNTPTPIPTGAVLANAKSQLAGLVLSQWRFEAALRSLNDPNPMPVQWHSTIDKNVIDHVENLATDLAKFAGASNEIATLVEQFHTLRRPRLIILGDAGSGKTTLAIQLLLELLAQREPDGPVPVLISLAGWDTTTTPRFQDWLAAQLESGYPALRSHELGGRHTVTTLANGRHILPILDGLDELPHSAVVAVIRALNRSMSNDDQLIITSRTKEFSAAIEAAGRVVSSAAVIELQPMTPADAANYLRSCLPQAPGPTWGQILTELDAINATHPAITAVADIASTPFGLWLLRAVYIDPHADPGPLLDSDRFPHTTALRTHLFDQLIDALITTRQPNHHVDDPFLPQNRWNPQQARYWLGYLAHYLDGIPSSDGQRGTRDFAWWQLARHAIKPGTLSTLAGILPGLAIALATIPRAGLALGLLVGLGFGSAVAFASQHWRHESPAVADFHVAKRRSQIPRFLGRLAAGTVGGITAGLTVERPVDPIGGLIGGLVFGLLVTALAWHRTTPDLARARPRLLGPLSQIMGGATGGVSAGLLLFGRTGAPGPGGPVVGLVAGIIAASTIGLTELIETPTSTDRADTPLTTWRSDRAVNLSRVVMGGLMGALICGLALGLFWGIEFVRTAIFGGTLGCAWIYGLVFGEHHAWPACLITTYRVAWARCLPFRLMPFLDDCHRLGLLRAVGPIYQFRHAELHDHLSRTYQPRS